MPDRLELPVILNKERRNKINMAFCFAKLLFKELTLTVCLPAKCNACFKLDSCKAIVFIICPVLKVFVFKILKCKLFESVLKVQTLEIDRKLGQKIR